jgi:hypothetical protein
MPEVRKFWVENPRPLSDAVDAERADGIRPAGGDKSLPSLMAETFKYMCFLIT